MCLDVVTAISDPTLPAQRPVPSCLTSIGPGVDAVLIERIGAQAEDKEMEPRTPMSYSDLFG